VPVPLSSRPDDGAGRGKTTAEKRGALVTIIGAGLDATRSAGGARGTG
jgi:hypothetical protein